VSAFTWAWVGFAAYFAVVEGVALYQSGKATGRGEADPRDTLSEHLWYWFGVNRGGTGVMRDSNVWARLRRVALGAAVLWLGVHLMTGGAYF